MFQIKESSFGSKNHVSVQRIEFPSKESSFHLKEYPTIMHQFQDRQLHLGYLPPKPDFRQFVFNLTEKLKVSYNIWRLQISREHEGTERDTEGVGCDMS